MYRRTLAYPPYQILFLIREFLFICVFLVFFFFFFCWVGWLVFGFAWRDFFAISNRTKKNWLNCSVLLTDQKVSLKHLTVRFVNMLASFIVKISTRHLIDERVGVMPCHQYVCASALIENIFVLVLKIRRSSFFFSGYFSILFFGFVVVSFPFLTWHSLRRPKMIQSPFRTTEPQMKLHCSNISNCNKE